TLPEWIYPLPLGDWPFFLLHAQTGKIGFLPDVMAAYRSHAQGAWMGQSRLKRIRQTIDVTIACRDNLEARYRRFFNYAIARGCIRLIEQTVGAKSDWGLLWPYIQKLWGVFQEDPALLPKIVARSYEKHPEMLAN
ncbi:MAG: hypothetical protein VKK59_04275, partial [Vampirovibrionales bacterium]|nr:hypothetical protein [Vampirovibrionales bacterium]